MREPILPAQAKIRLGPVRQPQPSAPGQLTEQDGFGDNPGALRMFAHIPERLPGNAPLVVILHGCGQTAAGYDHGAGWSELGNRLGFAVLAPEQQTANNMGGCFNWFQPGDTRRDQGEAASIRQMIAYLVAEHDLDARRVFITGLSAGGAMTAAMLAAYPEIFAGGAIIAGLAYGAASNVPEALSSMRRAPLRSPEDWGQAVRQASAHAGPWPVLSVWHGDADATVHVSNAEAVIGQWANLHGLGPEPFETHAGESHAQRNWRNAEGKAVLESHILAGMAHGAPIDAAVGGNAGPYFIEAGLSSTLQIARFWGLKQEAPVLAKDAVLTRRKPAAPAADLAKYNSQTPPDLGAQGSAPEAPAGLRGVIVKALKVAGLAK